MVKGFLVALIASLVYMESRIGGQHMLDRPVIIGPLVGLVMGDLKMGLFVGGNLELVWMGLVGIGTTTPPDVVVGSALATALAIETGATYETTLALAIPISLLAQLVSIGVCILNTVFAHRADKCAEKEDYRGVEVSNWMGSLVYFLAKFLEIFIGYMVGDKVITALVNNIPAGIQSGDILVRVGDREIGSALDLSTALKGLKVGDTVTLSVLRQKGTEYTEVAFPLTVAAR